MRTRVLIVLMVLAVIPAICSNAYSAPASYSFKCEDVQDPKVDPNVFGEVIVKKIDANGKVVSTFKYADSCKSDTTVFDKYCILPNSGTPGGKFINCKSGEKCESGKCIPVQPVASLADVTEPGWLSTASIVDDEFFSCGQLGFFIGFKVKGIYVFDCGGDGQIEYANNKGLLPPYSDNSSDEWVENDKLVQYKPYLDLLVNHTKERLATVVSNLGGINYVGANALGAGFLPPGSTCPPNTIFYMNFGGAESMAISCQGPASNCKMFNMGLDMNGGVGKIATPFVVQGWDKFWDSIPANYPQDAVTIMDALIDKLPDEITAVCNGQEVDINFVK